MKDNYTKIFKWIIGTLLVIAIAVMVYKIYSMDIGIDDIKMYVDSFGKLGPIVYITMFALVPLTLFPDSILAIAGGLAFGLFKGYIFTAIGALIGGNELLQITYKTT